MARLNVSDDWFLSDPRRDKLTKILGCHFKADGMALAGWRLAQRYWKDEKQLIPLEIWEMGDLQPLLDCGLAAIHDDGVYVCGTKDHHDWIYCRVEAGRTGGKANGSKNKQSEANESKRKPLSLSLSLSKKEDMSEPAGSDDQGPGLNLPKPTSPRELAETWNAKADGLPHLNLDMFKAGSKRWRSAASRLRENPDIAYWSSTIEKIAKLPFCRGENKTGWRANFDWLLQPDSHIKINEGNYAGANGYANGNGHAPKRPRREMGTDI